MSKRKSSKKIRLRAAELAVDAAAGMEDYDTAKIFALAIFFENWITLGGDETDKRMKLLSRKSKVVKLKLVPEEPK